MTLRDLVIRQQVTGESDSELVTEWLLSNGDVTEHIKTRFFMEYTWVSI